MHTTEMEVRYKIGERGADTIIIDPKLTCQQPTTIPNADKIPRLCVKNPTTKVDEELRQLFDSLDERGSKQLPTRCLAMLFRAARVKKFLNPLESAKLVDECLDMLEVEEKEATFDYAFFKAMVLLHTNSEDLPTNSRCLRKIDVAAVMTMMGLPLSDEEAQQYRSPVPVTRKKISLKRAFKIYEYVRGQRLRVMLSDSQQQLQSLATQRIGKLLQKYRISKLIAIFNFESKI